MARWNSPTAPMDKKEGSWMLPRCISGRQLRCEGLGGFLLAPLAALRHGLARWRAQHDDSVSETAAAFLQPYTQQFMRYFTLLIIFKSREIAHTPSAPCLVLI